jgi:hypothetical protein
MSTPDIVALVADVAAALVALWEALVACVSGVIDVLTAAGVLHGV